MAVTLIDNTDLDTVAAAIPAPYGPLTRVGNAPNYDFNSNVRVEFTSALSLSVFMSYDQLFDVDQAVEDLETYHSVRGYNNAAWDLFRIIKTVFYNADSYAGPPYSDAELQAIVAAMRTSRILQALPVNLSVKQDEMVNADFTVADTGTNEATVTNLSTGEISFYLWDWGDTPDAFSIGASPAAHTYVAGAGTYTVTLTVVGRGGVAQHEESVTVS